MQYTLVRSKKRRRSVSMRVNNSGELEVRAPVLMPRFVIDRFVSHHQDWVQKQMRIMAEPPTKLVKYFTSVNILENFIRLTVAKYESVMSLKSSGLRFTNVRSYWGSCAPSGVISFNLHLIHAPRQAVEYVVVHELSHLKYRGHGIRFWRLVNSYFPKSNEMKKILRQIARGKIQVG